MIPKIDIDDFRDQARLNLSELTAQQKKDWGFGTSGRWDADQKNGIITWTLDNGITAKANYQIIGTYSLQDENFLWSWGNSSIQDNLKSDARAVLDFAEQNNIDFLQSAVLICSKEDAWDFAAIATLVNERQGAYRGTTDDNLVFMTYGDVAVSKNTY